MAFEHAVRIGVDADIDRIAGRTERSWVSLKFAVTQTSRGTNIINAWPTAA